MPGNYDTSNQNPCPTCPIIQCTRIPYQASLAPGSHRFQPNTKLAAKQKWDTHPTLKSGSGSVKGKPTEFEIKELADSRMLVSFTNGNTKFYAKLTVCRVEANEAGRAGSINDFAIGQEIDAPPADQKVRDVSNQLTVNDANVATIRIGTTDYQVITATPLTK
jgi:hypothetical protein